MNQQGCSPGFASDEALITPQTNEKDCSISLTVYWILGGIIITIRILFNVYQFLLSKDFWERRAKASSSNESRKHSNRIGGLTTLFELYITINIITIVVLIYFGIANAINGWAPALFGLAFFPFSLAYCHFARHNVKLGMRIVPAKFRAQNDETVNNSVSSITGDSFILIYICFIGLATIGVFLFYIVLPLALPHLITLWVQFGSGCSAAVVLILPIIIRRQTFRIVAHMDQMAQAVDALGANTTELKRVKTRLQQRWRLILVGTIPSFILYMVTACGIQFSIYILYVHIFLAAFGSMSASFGIRRSRKTKSGVSASSGKVSSPPGGAGGGFSSSPESTHSLRIGAGTFVLASPNE